MVRGLNDRWWVDKDQRGRVSPRRNKDAVLLIA
jgi:hypothetical protein